MVWLLRGVFTIASCLIAFAALGESGIYPWLETGDRVQGTLAIDEVTVCSLDHLAQDDRAASVPICSFTIPTAAKIITLSGSLQIEGQKAARFDHRWRAIDVSPLTAVLYEEQLALAKRIERFVGQLVEYETRFADEFYSPVQWEPRTGDTETEFAAAEARLELELPEALQLLSSFHLQVEDSHSLAPAQWRPVREVLVGEWGNEDLSFLSEATAARYERSTIVFVEVGDGLGALAWDPEGARAGEPSNVAGADRGRGALAGVEGEGLWFWLHQDSLDEPTLILGADRRPRSAEAAILSILQRFAIEVAMEELAYLGAFGAAQEPILLFDSAHPRGRFQLSFLEPKRRKVEARLWFRSYDYDHSLH